MSIYLTTCCSQFVCRNRKSHLFLSQSWLPSVFKVFTLNLISSYSLVMRNGNKLKSYLVVFAPSRAYILDGSEEGVHILYSRFMRKLNHFFFQFQANPNSNPTLRNTRNRSKSKENIRNKNKIISNFGMKIIMKNYKCFILSFLF